MFFSFWIVEPFRQPYQMTTPAYNPHVEGRTEGAAHKPLSKRQIVALIRLAREAFGYLCDNGTLGEAAEFDVWRHEQCLQCVERDGFRACGNEDYLPLRRHFLRLLGRDQEADAAEDRMEVEPRTWALDGLQHECTAAADVMPRAMDYATGYLRNRGMSIDTADHKAIWHAAYTVRRRAGQLRRKAA